MSILNTVLGTIVVPGNESIIFGVVVRDGCKVMLGDICLVINGLLVSIVHF